MAPSKGSQERKKKWWHYLGEQWFVIMLVLAVGGMVWSHSGPPKKHIGYSEYFYCAEDASTCSDGDSHFLPRDWREEREEWSHNILNPRNWFSTPNSRGEE
jgi:hypothetical protein